VAGYDDRQVASTMGLLGTIVGYVLGTSRTPASPAGTPPVTTPADGVKPPGG